MKKYNVIFKVYDADGHSRNDSVEVEAGNKKAAYNRALSEISKRTELSGKYKKIVQIEEVA